MLNLRNIQFKNKILISTLMVIMLLGVGVTLASRWILMPSLITQLKERGLGIAQSIVENGRGYILTENVAELTSLIFDAARLEERRRLITYVFVSDTKDRVLSHTFTVPFPETLRSANPIPAGKPYSIKLLHARGQPIYDIAVPILEGIYHIGTVHVGLSESHIGRLISKLAKTFVGITAAILVISIIFSNFVSKYITRPISQLTRVSDEISRGNLEIKAGIGSEVHCWEIQNCDELSCPAFGNTDIPCWYVDGTLCEACRLGDFPEKLECCKACVVYSKRVGDEIVQLADSFSNMTCRLRASETEIKESEEKYRTLFDSTPNSIFVLEEETFRILDVNARALEIYGYKKDEFLEKSFLDLGPMEYTSGVLSARGDRRSDPSSVYSKIRHHKKDGTPLYVNVYAIRSERSSRYGIVAVTVNITETLAKESQLIQASKMSTLGEMASGVAHELNQPLSAIQIGSDLIRNAVKGDRADWGDLPEVVRHMTEQVDRAVGIINHLREFGRKTGIKKEIVYINHPIRGVFKLLDQQLKLHGIRVELDLAEGLPPILGDSNRLEQVFINLVVNARNAMEEKDEQFVKRDMENVLTVKSFKDRDKVVVTVTDTGTGISDQIKEKIFEPFFTTKRVGEGTGLGLSISYGIVKDYNGRIEVESEVGKGTQFRITFPSHTEA